MEDSSRGPAPGVVTYYNPFAHSFENNGYGCSQVPSTLSPPHVYFACCPFPGISLGHLPPPGSIACVAVAPAVHQSMAWSAASSTALPTVSWSAGSTLTPPFGPAASTLPQHSGLPPMPPSGGLILSPAGEVLPRKLVDKIQSRQFVDMKELLSDNIALLQQLEATQGQAIQIIGPTRPRLREVTSLATWSYCFLGYMAVLTTDATTRDQLAYARLLIREAQRHGGQSWLDYDRAFRQQAAADPTTPWNTINPGLQAATILTQRPSSQTTFCTLCRMVDHSRSQCALQYLEPAPSSGQRPMPPAWGRRTRPQICYSWNQGTCSFPGRCAFRHICSSCTNPYHKATECPGPQSVTQTSQGPTLRPPAVTSAPAFRR